MRRTRTLRRLSGGSRIASLIRKAELCPDGAAMITDTLRPAGVAGTVRLPLYSAVEPVKRPDGSSASVPSSSGPKGSPSNRSKSSS